VSGLPDAVHRPLPVDGARYTIQDAAGTVRSVGPRWRHLLEGVDDVPKAAIVALEGLGEVLTEAGGSGADLIALSRGVDQRLTALSDDHGATANLVEVVGEHDPLVHATESVDRLLSIVGRTIADSYVPRAEGRLDRINISGGGVPKTPVDGAEVAFDGLVGDRQNARRHHGRPWQALCLWSTGVIDALVAEGHPISAGSAGENLTLGGLEWSTLRLGTRLVVGDGADAVVIELSAWAEPCAKNNQWFADGDSRRMHHDRHPGWSRAYAAVVSPGKVAVGDVVRVVP